MKIRLALLLPLLAVLSLGQSAAPQPADLIGLNELALRFDSNSEVNYLTAKKIPESAERFIGRAEAFTIAAASIRMEMTRMGWDGAELPRRSSK